MPLDSATISFGAFSLKIAASSVLTTSIPAPALKAAKTVWALDSKPFLAWTPRSFPTATVPVIIFFIIAIALAATFSS